MGGGQGHPQAGGGEHHQHLFGAGEIGKEFGVAGEGLAGLVDHALVHRAGDQGAEDVVATAEGGTAQGFEDVAGIGRIGMPRFGRREQGDGDHRQFAGAVFGAIAIEVGEPDGQAELPRPGREQLGIGDGHQRGRPFPGGDPQEQIGAHAGRFAGGDGDGRCGGGHWLSRYST